MSASAPSTTAANAPAVDLAASTLADVQDAQAYLPPPQPTKKRKTVDKRSRVNSSEVPESEDGAGKKRNRVHFRYVHGLQRTGRADRALAVERSVGLARKQRVLTPARPTVPQVRLTLTYALADRNAADVNKKCASHPDGTT